MKVFSVTEKIELHSKGNVLCLISEGDILLEGFTDIGVYSNGLIPVVFFNEKRFLYVDGDTFDIYEIKNVDWISGFHYVGNDLNYMGHNYRTDPTKKTADYYKFKTIEGVKYMFEKFDGCEMTVKSERKFDFDLQKMVETGKVEITCALTPQLSQKLFNEIKYYRIVGRGVLSKGLDMGSQPVKLDDGNKYNPLSFTLSQKNDLYGVVDVRTNKLLLETKYKKIDILPEALIVDSGEIINI